MAEAGKEEENDKSECPDGRLGLPWNESTVPALHLNRGVTEGPICHLWDPPEPGLCSVAGPAGLSPKEFFGLHCQMSVQFRHGVIGHLADLFLYESNGIL